MNNRGIRQSISTRRDPHWEQASGRPCAAAARGTMAMAVFMGTPARKIGSSATSALCPQLQHRATSGARCRLASKIVSMRLLPMPRT